MCRCLISKAVDADLNVTQIITGWIIGAIACSAFVIGVIHGELLPRFLRVGAGVRLKQ
jgi:hypothetical protein